MCSYGNLLNFQAFGPLKKKHPNFKNKVYGIEGDIKLENVGLNELDRKMLIDNVSVVINCAAAVRFDEDLKTATCTNVKSIKYLIDIARQMKLIKAFVQISTAYSFCPHKEIKEVVYKPRIKAEELLQIVESWDENVLSDVTKT